MRAPFLSFVSSPKQQLRAQLVWNLEIIHKTGLKLFSFFFFFSWISSGLQVREFRSWNWFPADGPAAASPSQPSSGFSGVTPLVKAILLKSVALCSMGQQDAWHVWCRWIYMYMYIYICIHTLWHALHGLIFAARSRPRIRPTFCEHAWPQKVVFWP